MADDSDIEVIVRARTTRGSTHAETVAAELASHLGGMPGGVDVTLCGADFPASAGGGADGQRRRLRALRDLVGLRATVVIDDEEGDRG